MEVKKNIQLELTGEELEALLAILHLGISAGGQRTVTEVSGRLLDKLRQKVGAHERG